MRRDVLPTFLMVSVLLAAGGFAWLTHHPESALLERAQAWPGVGPLAQRFREAYLPPTVPAADSGPAATAAEAEGIGSPGEVDRVRPPNDAAPRGARPYVWVTPGVELKARPSAAAATRHRFAVIANVPFEERRGDWYRVEADGRVGWVRIETDDDEPPLGDEPEPPGPLPPRAPEAAELAAARQLLAGERRSTLGPYAFYTDVDAPDLVDLLAGLAAELDEVYATRYGRRPLGTPRSAVVLYAREEAYRQLQERSRVLVGLTPVGHASGGLAVSYSGARDKDEVAATLVHELVHQVNRRALGPALPPWLDEGVADDLAMSSLVAGALDPGGFGGTIVRHEEQVGEVRRTELVASGAIASLWYLDELRSSGRLPPLRELVELDWQAFVDPAVSRRNYAAAGLFVRYLMSAEGGRYVEPFRAFLTAIADGGPATGEALRARLGREWAQLEAGFGLWLSFTAERYGQGDAGGSRQREERQGSR